MKQKSRFKQTEIGKIPEEWEVKMIGDFLDVKHGFAFKGEFFSDAETDNILLTPGNFNIGGGFKSDKLKFTTEEPPKDYILKEGDIIVTMTDLSKKGDTLGYSAKIPPTKNKKYLHNQRVGLVNFRSDKVNSDFIYWVLRTKRYNIFVVGSATGSTVKHTSPNRIKLFEFCVPTITEQTQIAKILSDLDSKIELNHRMTKTLEAIGLTLFNKWFNIDEIPEDWQTKPLDEIAEYLNGLPLQKYPAGEDEEYLPVIKIRELRNGISDQTERASLDIPDEYIIDDGDVLFSWSGTLEVEIWTNGKGALNQHLFKASSKEYPKWFYYFWTKHFLPKFRHIAKGKATTMGHIQRHNLKEAEVIVPDKKAMEEMDKIMSSIVKKIIKVNLESRALGAIRDSLLPKLMSGKIRVPVAVRQNAKRV